MKKRTALLCAILCALAIAGCDSSETPPAQETENTAPAAPLKTLISAETGSDYILVRSDIVSTGTSLDLAQRIRDTIKEATGVSPALKTDWYKETMGTVPQAREILIGSTNREETVAVENAWRPNGVHDWIVRLSGEKIVLYGGSDAALTEAVEHFLQNCVADGAVSMPENYEYSYQYKWALEDVKVAGETLGEYQIVIGLNADTMTTAAAERLRNFFAENAGIQLDIVKDSMAAKKRDCEIVIGETNRASGLSGDPVYVIQKDKRLFVGGADSIALNAAVQALINGSAGETKDGVYTVAASYTAKEYDLLSSGALEWMKSLTDQRAAIGRQKTLDALTTLINRSDADLADADKYGNLSVPVLYLTNGEATEQQMAFANKMVRKVAGYISTDIPPSVKTENGGNGPSGEVDFAAIRLVRALYAPEENVEQATYDRLKQFFLNDDFLSKYSSENHNIMERAARYLAACYYKGERFNQYYKTAEELVDIDGKYLKNMMRSIAQQGYGEFDTFGYASVVFLTYMNLYECSPDEEMRELARMSMDTLLMNVIADTTENGIYGGAHGRSYNVTGTLQRGIYWAWYLYFGSDTAGFTGATSVENIMAYFSDYRPDDIIYAIAADKTYPYTNLERSHMITQKNGSGAKGWKYGYLNRYTYNTELYSIGCVQQHEKQTDEPLLEDVQQTNWLLGFAENPKAMILTHHPGDTSYHGLWYGDSYCNCNHLFGHEDTVMGIFFIPGNAAKFNYIHAWLQKDQFDEVVEIPEKNLIYVRLGDAYARLQFTHPYAWSEERAAEILVYDEDRINNIRIGFVCEAGMKSEYGDFAGFMAAMDKKELSYNRSDLQLTYGNMEIRIDYDKKQTVVHQYLDGVEQTYPYANTYDSPYMKSVWDSGVIELYYGDTVRVMDFMKVTDTTTKK